MQEQPTLFDKPAVNQPLANKIDSFYSKDVQKKRLTQKERVLNAILDLGIASDREVSVETGIARHLIPDRRKSLGDKIKVAYTAEDPVTGKPVTYYEVTNA